MPFSSYVFVICRHSCSVDPHCEFRKPSVHLGGMGGFPVSVANPAILFMGGPTITKYSVSGREPRENPMASSRVWKEQATESTRSEERRVGKECRDRRSEY